MKTDGGLNPCLHSLEQSRYGGKAFFLNHFLDALLVQGDQVCRHRFPQPLLLISLRMPHIGRNGRLRESPGASVQTHLRGS